MPRRSATVRARTANFSRRRCFPRGRRKLVRYLGTDESRWDDRFVRYLHDDPRERGTVWLRLTPSSLRAQDLSYTVAPPSPAPRPPSPAA